MKAFCFANGEIVFGRSVPENAILIATAPSKQLRDVIGGMARAYDNKTLLVPGIPESSNIKEAFRALDAFQKNAARRLSNNGGVR